MIKNILVSQPKPADPIKSPYNELAKKYNLEVDFEKFIKVVGIPARDGKQNFKDLLEVIKKHKDDKFLLPCSDIHKLSIPKLLDDSKINYSKAIIYKTLATDLSKVDIKKYDMLIFFSPSGVASLLKNFPGFEQGDTKIGVFGPATAKAVKEAGFKLSLNAPTKSAPSMTMALNQFLEKDFKKNGRGK
ncbi:MAG: hypothetical protein B6I19_09930 [Bacteroidetes bacterium 4572_114]|nr:MAG: hypothetical protein B6I19_09930 [Bacteroidetes bacterium 4572_114]